MGLNEKPINPIKTSPLRSLELKGDYHSVELEGVALGFAAFKAKQRKNVFDEPDEHSDACISYAMARKGRIKFNPHEGETSRGRNEVELEGVEPSSEQGNHTLSTRLS